MSFVEQDIQSVMCNLLDFEIISAVALLIIHIFIKARQPPIQHCINNEINTCRFPKRFTVSKSQKYYPSVQSQLTLFCSLYHSTKVFIFCLTIFKCKSRKVKRALNTSKRQSEKRCKLYLLQVQTDLSLPRCTCRALFSPAAAQM